MANGGSSLRGASGLFIPGSMPADIETDAEAMRIVLKEAGDLIRYVPSGETGKRRDWIRLVLERLRDHPSIELVKDGDWSSYDQIPQFRIKPGCTLDPGTLNVDIWDNYAENYATYEKLVKEFGLTGEPPILLDDKGDFDLGVFAFGRPRGVGSPAKHRTPWREANVREIKDVFNAVGDRVVFNLSLPAEMITAVTAKCAWPVVNWMGSVGVEVVKECPPEARIGLHGSCNGDLCHQGYVKARAAAAVAMTNSLVRHWPKGHRPPEYVLVSLAAGDVPPPVKEEFYAALMRLRVPAQTRIILGFLHAGLTLRDVRLIYGWCARFVSLARQATNAADAPAPMVGPSCGCGRCSLTDTLTVIHQGVELCEPRSKGTTGMADEQEKHAEHVKGWVDSGNCSPESAEEMTNRVDNLTGQGGDKKD